MDFTPKILWGAASPNEIRSAWEGIEQLEGQWYTYKCPEQV